MGFAHGAGQVLGREEVNMVRDVKHLRFRVKMVDGSHLQSSRGDVDTVVLDRLEAGAEVSNARNSYRRSAPYP